MIGIEILLASFLYLVTNLVRRYWWRIQYWHYKIYSLHSPETYRVMIRYYEDKVRWEKWRYGNQ